MGGCWAAIGAQRPISITRSAASPAQLLATYGGAESGRAMISISCKPRGSARSQSVTARACKPNMPTTQRAITTEIRLPPPQTIITDSGKHTFRGRMLMKCFRVGRSPAVMISATTPCATTIPSSLTLAAQRTSQPSLLPSTWVGGRCRAV